MDEARKALKDALHAANAEPRTAGARDAVADAIEALIDAKLAPVPTPAADKPAK